jgi:hypothetical protein
MEQPIAFGFRGTIARNTLANANEVRIGGSMPTSHGI